MNGNSNDLKSAPFVLSPSKDSNIVFQQPKKKEWRY